MPALRMKQEESGIFNCFSMSRGEEGKEAEERGGKRKGEKGRERRGLKVIWKADIIGG